MVLGHSRHMFARAVFDQRAETWQQLHVEAFAHFRGVPKVIVPDNLKAAVVKAAFSTGDDPSLHRGYAELARHYGFTIDPAPPRDPEKKGKVEAGAKYVGINFLATLPEGLDRDEANRRLDRWVMEVAGRRVHGTTRQQPLKAFEEEERGSLLPLPTQPYRITIWRKLLVHRDTHVAFDGRFYSVPFRFIGGSACWRPPQKRPLRRSPSTPDAASGLRRPRRSWSSGVVGVACEHLVLARRADLSAVLVGLEAFEEVGLLREPCGEVVVGGGCDAGERGGEAVLANGLLLESPACVDRGEEVEAVDLGGKVALEPEAEGLGLVELARLDQLAGLLGERLDVRTVALAGMVGVPGRDAPLVEGLATALVLDAAPAGTRLVASELRHGASDGGT